MKEVVVQSASVARAPAAVRTAMRSQLLSDANATLGCERQWTHPIVELQTVGGEVEAPPFATQCPSGSGCNNT
jgi:hypothetical protein